MSKASFTVSYRNYGRVRTTILGVTSIVPNLNGLLLFTEDGENYQIEGSEMIHGAETSSYVRLFVEYTSEEDILAEQKDPGVIVLDHRSK